MQKLLKAAYSGMNKVSTIFKHIFLMVALFLLPACSNHAMEMEAETKIQIDSSAINMAEVETGLEELWFVNVDPDKVFTFTENEGEDCIWIVYESEIVDRSDENKTFEQPTEITIKYPEFFYAIKETEESEYELFTKETLNYFIKKKAMYMYFNEYGVYRARVISTTDYEIKLLNKDYLSILFKCVSVENTRYSYHFAINFDLRKDELHQHYRDASEREAIFPEVILNLTEFINKENILQQIEEGNYKIYSSRGEGITEALNANRIMSPFMDNIDKYFDNPEKFFLTDGAIVFLSDEASHKGDSYEIMIPQL